MLASIRQSQHHDRDLEASHRFPAPSVQGSDRPRLVVLPTREGSTVGLDVGEPGGGGRDGARPTITVLVPSQGTGGSVPAYVRNRRKDRKMPVEGRTRPRLGRRSGAIGRPALDRRPPKQRSPLRGDGSARSGPARRVHLTRAAQRALGQRVVRPSREDREPRRAGADAPRVPHRRSGPLRTARCAVLRAGLRFSLDRCTAFADTSNVATQPPSRPSRSTRDRHWPRHRHRSLPHRRHDGPLHAFLPSRCGRRKSLLPEFTAGRPQGHQRCKGCHHARTYARGAEASGFLWASRASNRLGPKLQAGSITVRLRAKGAMTNDGEP